MGYLARLRDLAAAPAAPAAPPPAAVEPLEQEAVRIARHVESPAAVASRRAPGIEPTEAARKPADRRGEAADGPTPPPAPQALRELESEPTRRAAVVDADASPPAGQAEPLPLEREVILERPSSARRPVPAPPEAPPGIDRRGREPKRAPAPAPPPPTPPREARLPAPESSKGPQPQPDERFHQALVQVRRWMVEPEPGAAEEGGGSGKDGKESARDESPAAVAPLRSEPPMSPVTPNQRSSRPRETPPPERPAPLSAPAAQVVEERTELSIGTIYVTVEEPEAGPPTQPGGRPATSRSARGEAVPRNYLRGW